MDPIELTPEPEVFSTAEPLPTKSNSAVERTRHAMEQRWGARWDNSHNDDGNRDGNEDEDGDGDGDDGDGDGDDGDGNDGDGDGDGDGEEDKDMGEDNEDENDILGLSTWDLLGADFEYEAAALGLS